jgi:hypothetical protein
MIRCKTFSFLRSLSWLLFACAMFAVPAQAAVIAPRNLYEGEVQFDPKSPPARDALIQQAFGQVLVRITGDREIAKRKPGIELMKLATRLVQQYDYDRRPAPPVKGTVPAVPARGITVFRARFDARVLDAQLRERGLPVWGRERPVTQIWLGVQEGGSRWLLTEGIAAVEAPSLLQAALARGVPVTLPAAAGANELQDVMQGTTGSLLAAARAQGQPLLLVGRVTQKGAQWSGQWQLLENGQVRDRWQGTAANREEALSFGIDQMANAYAASYAVRGGSAVTGGALRLEVAGIGSAADYARVSKYLASLSAVSAVDVVELTDSRAVYALKLRGDRINLQQAIALGSLLEPTAAAAPAPESPDAPLLYRLAK